MFIFSELFVDYEINYFLKSEKIFEKINTSSDDYCDGLTKSKIELDGSAPTHNISTLILRTTKENS